MTDSVEHPLSRWFTARVVVAFICLVGAQVVHWSVIGPHNDEWPVSGTFFFVLAIVEALAAVAMLFALNRQVVAGVIAISVIPIVIWVWDRAFGLPIGPTQGIRGTFGRSDVLSILLEVVVVVSLWPFLRAGYAEQTPAKADLSSKIVIVATLLYVTAFSYWAVIGDTSEVHQGVMETETPSGVTRIPLDISSITQPTLPPASTP